MFFCVFFLCFYVIRISACTVINADYKKDTKKHTKKVTKKFLHEIPCKIYIFYNKNIPCKKHKKVTKKSQKKSQKNKKVIKKFLHENPC